LSVKLTTSSPCRVDLAGGTVDIWPLYLYHSGAVTLNFAINRRTHCTVETRPDKKVVLRSVDQRQEESFDSIDKLVAARSYKLPLPAWILRFFRPPSGLTVETLSEAPAGAGISGSSSLMITLGSAMNRLLGTRYSLERLREICQNIESQIIRVPTGSQDYYPALYGGVSAIEMGPGGIRRHAVPVNLDEFNSRVVLAYTGEPRNSGINNWAVMKEHINGNRAVERNFARITAIAKAMREALGRADWTETARLLREEWSHRRRNFPGISTPLIDRLVDVTRKAGARGAKVCGAGGGGCVLFLVEPDASRRVAALLQSEGAEVLAVKVARRGVKIEMDGQD
jgi:D-glycero-alpha-D-manno-heptose-7-phosphate kinase